VPGGKQIPRLAREDKLLVGCKADRGELNGSKDFGEEAACVNVLGSPILGEALIHSTAVKRKRRMGSLQGLSIKIYNSKEPTTKEKESVAPS
jgi:hypothetical protein